MLVTSCINFHKNILYINFYIIILKVQAAGFLMIQLRCLLHISFNFKAGNLYTFLRKLFLIASTNLINEPRHEKTKVLYMGKTKMQISFAVTAKLISAFVFAT